MTDFIKSKIGWWNSIYKTFQYSSKNLAQYDTLQQAITEVSDLIYEKKNDYYNALAKKLSDSTTSFKTYWSISKTFYNTKKVPIMPPILIENKLETDFLKKLITLISFFASKCTPLSNSSSLPSSFDLETEARLTSINFSDNDILKIIRSLDIRVLY